MRDAGLEGFEILRKALIHLWATTLHDNNGWSCTAAGPGRAEGVTCPSLRLSSELADLALKVVKLQYCVQV